MTDTPRKTLTLKRKTPTEVTPVLSPTEATAPEEATVREREGRLLGNKRIIRREERIPERPARQNTKRPPTGMGKARAERTPRVAVPEGPAPSELQAKALDRLLAHTFPTWLEYKPLSHGIEGELYAFMDQHQPPASKRVVQRLLRMHCNHGKYLQGVVEGSVRFDLNGQLSGDISGPERDHAVRTLAGQELKKHNA